jgi:hypothetical protein
MEGAGLLIKNIWVKRKMVNVGGVALLLLGANNW